ncbi:DUF5057 domain-containing protein [Paenibacillus glycanilyticus]|uniref:BIG2 domain-containing protein n=1 Tax=Paenibacillus glycanilyticus TaxID=126569 RepID=A0ABQ6GGT0_9BACL|nr:DUF5057 domain-containing protein [Paenibacillus glycanilyticus]GLX69295.1 hypothetical protein MU1_36400 [Paenibacillus glycanilyticus]
MKSVNFQKRISITLVITLLASVFAFVGYPVKHAEAANTFDLGLVALKSSGKGKFVRVTTSGTTPTADSNDVWKEELFVLQKSGNYYTLKSNNTGKYLTAPTSTSSSVKADATSVTNSQKFSIAQNTDGTVSFLAYSKISGTKYYLGSASDNYLYTGSSTIGAAQKFKLTSYRNAIRILEVTESGTSDLYSILGTNTPIPFTIDTYSMKEFVASRDDLDGKYDVVYIGKGTLVDKDNKAKTPYSMTLLGTQTQGTTQSNNHNTSSIQNDITQLKANEITNDFITKGLPVIFYNDSGTSNGVEYQADLSSTNKALLKKNFLPYKTQQSTTSVIFVDSTNISTADNFMSKTNLLEKANVRPQLTVTSKPNDYTANQANQYKAGDTISFGYTIDNVGDISSKNIELNLYISTDSALPFGAEQVVATKQANSASGTITYTLPKGYSGIQYWRLEAVDFNTKLKDYTSGVYRFQDQKINIKVLQVMPNDSSASSLKDTNNMKSAYLAPTSGNTSDAYSISIDTMNMNTFNSDGYKTLNGKYDMLIFGFGDIYNNNAPISDNAAAAVITFINTKQSVMFTHDTIYNSSNSNSRNWLDKFQDITGQIAPRTDLGLGAPESSTTTEKVNDGLLTQFPFLLSDTTNVATTHNQYYTLKLEDPTVIPWYNMSGGKRTSGDSWNSFYTYSKENVTYSGSGHTNSKFPDWEQQLFVNTMYRAYLGSNHAPQLTVNSPVEYNSTTNNFIPSYQNILLNYQVDDFDLGDRELKTSVDFTYSGKTEHILTNESVLAGGTINKQIANPLPNGGDLKIDITATDKSGAVVSKTINVKIVKVESNIDLSRTVSSNVKDNRVQTNTAATFTYTITPKPIAASGSLTADQMKITNIKFNETLPANLEVTTLPSGFTKTGSATTGYTVSGTLNQITYSLNGNNYTAVPMSFEIGVKPTKDGLYPLQNAVLTFNDIGQQTARTLMFPSYVLEAVTKLTSLSLTDSTLLVGDSRKMIPTIAPLNATYGSAFTWETDRPDLVTVDNSGILKGIAAGTARITARATDGSGLIATAAVTAIKPGLNIVGQNRVATGDSINLAANLYTADYEKITSYQWSITTGSSKISLTGSTNSTVSVTGNSIGTATVHLTVGTDQSNKYESDITITVYKKVTSITVTGTKMFVGDTYQLNPVVGPSDATDKSIVYLPSSDSSVATVNSSGLVTAVGAGEARITVQAQDGSGVTGTAVITVVKRTLVTSIDLTGTTMQVGSTYQLNPVVSPADATNKSVTWTSSKPNIATVNSTGLVTAVSVGETTITAQAQDGSGVQGTAVITVIRTIPVASIAITDTTLVVGSTYDLNPVISPSDATNKTTTLSSSNPNIANVNSSGIVTAVSAGVAVITVQAQDGSNVKGTATITVINPAAVITGPTSLELGTDGTMNASLQPQIPGDAINVITWSFTEGVDQVTVKGSTTGTSLTFTGKKAGKIKIKATIRTNSGKIFTAEQEITIKSVRLQLEKTYRIKVGTSKELFDALASSPAAGKNNIKGDLAWTSSNPAIAKVDANTGRVTGVKTGTVTITVTYRNDPSITAKTTIIVERNSNGEKY